MYSDYNHRVLLASRLSWIGYMRYPASTTLRSVDFAHIFPTKKGKKEPHEREKNSCSAKPYRYPRVLFKRFPDVL